MELYQSSEKGDLSAVLSCLDAGADPEWLTDYGTSALGIAAMNGHEEIVRAFINYGANVFARDSREKTALMWAATGGHMPIVKFLIGQMANVDETENCRFIDPSLRDVSCEVFDAIFSAQDCLGFSVLTHAALNGRDEVVRFLIDLGANVEATDTSGNTPLIVASLRGHDTIVKFLLEKGAKLETRDVTQKTVLMHASTNGHDAVVKSLIDSGAILEAQDDDGVTAFMCASMRGHDTVAKVFIQCGANLELRDKRGFTVLIFACFGGYDTLVKLLIESGANVDGRDIEGKTALMHTLIPGPEISARFLMRAKVESRMSIIQQLLQAGANPLAKDNTGKVFMNYVLEEYRDRIQDILNYYYSNGYQGGQLK